MGNSLKKTENQTPHKPPNLEEIAVSVLMNSRFYCSRWEDCDVLNSLRFFKEVCLDLFTN